MAYSKINWENEPSILTPINETNLNHMDAGIYNLDQNKLDKANPRATGSLAVSGYSLLAEPGLGSAQFGYDSIATGYNSLAAGFMTRATGSESFTAGSHTQAASGNQTAIGKYNIKDNDEKYPFIIGNGTGTDEDTSNAFTVSWDGDVEAAGEITDGNGITLSELLPTDTASGNPCVITDAFGGKAKSLSLDIEPIQDLHGYDKPWIGGAGKNKLPLVLSNIKSLNTTGSWNSNTYTINSMSFQIQTDDSGNVTGIKTSGTPSANTSFNLATFSGTGETYAYNGCPSGGGASSKYKMDVCDYPISQNIATDTGSGTTFATAVGTNYIARIVVYTDNTSSTLTFKPMVRLSSVSDDSFAPYTNICPISGISSGTITRTGKNLFDGSQTISNIYGDSSGKYVYSAIGSYIVPIKGGETYTISTPNAQTIFTSTSADYPAVGVDIVDAYSGSSGLSVLKKTISTSPSANYLVFHFGGLPNYNNVQVELGSTNTPYEPYNGQTITRTYGQTVYSGSDDVTGSGAVSTMASITLNGTEQGWTNFSGSGFNQFVLEISDAKDALNPICDKFEKMQITDRGTKTGLISYNDKMFRFALKSSDFNIVTLPDWLTWLSSNNVTVCYEKATPTTISLASQNIDLLHGDNVIVSNAKTVNVSYKADVQLYIDKKLSE